MSEKPSFWQRLGLHDFFLSKPALQEESGPAGLSPERIYQYLLQQFDQSLAELSFSRRAVFYHEYLVILNPDDYRQFQERRKGLFGHIAQEAVQAFQARLAGKAADGLTVSPSAGRWVFRFVSHHDYSVGDIGFMGKLLPDGAPARASLRGTYIPRQTGMAETHDLSPDVLTSFTYYSEGYYELPYEGPRASGASPSATTGVLARLEAIVPDKAYTGRKLEFLMQEEEITVTGTADQRQERGLFRIPSEWVDTPHLRIRYNRGEDRFFIAAFGEKTVVNERELPASAPQHPAWSELPVNSRIVLNGIVGLNLFKS